MPNHVQRIIQRRIAAGNLVGQRGGHDDVGHNTLIVQPAVGADQIGSERLVRHAGAGQGQHFRDVTCS